MVEARIAAAAALTAAGIFVTFALPSAGTATPPGRNGLIAFVAGNGGFARGIAVIRSDGSGFRHMTRNRRDRSPSWSPDGKRLAFERAGDIYVIRADGTRLRRLTRHLRGGQPAWSPDAEEIAFIRKAALYVVRADGTRERALFRRRGVVANRPSWSPGGARIAFGVTSEDEHGGFDAGSIVVIGRRDGRLRYVTDGRREPPEDADPGTWAEDRGPDWSPDGKRIAFTRLVWLCPRCDQDEIFSVNVDGSDAAPLGPETGSSSGPAWSPDGSLVAADGVAILRVAGTLARLLRSGSAPAWQPLPR